MAKAIGYDIDNVLKPTFQLGLDLINRNYGTNYTLADFKQATYEESFGMSKVDIDAIFKQAYEEGLLSKLKPIKDAKRIVNKYNLYLEQYFVTARSEWMAGMTLEWFGRNRFIYAPKNVIFGNNTPEKKAAVAKDLGLRLFIEDNLLNANAIAEENSIPVLLVDFNYPFNRNKSYHHLVRVVYDWKEINREIRRILKPF